MAKALNLVVDDDDSVYFSKYSDDGRMNINQQLAETGLNVEALIRRSEE